MSYSIQDSETGEVDYIQYDNTTSIEMQTLDEETGEPSNDNWRIRYVKHKRFHIPKKYLRVTPCEEFEREMMGEPIQWNGIKVKAITTATQLIQLPASPPHYAREDYINMEGVKNDIILGYNKTNHRMFLVPTLFFFNIYFAVLITLIETLLHFWAHKKNGLNMNKKFYYRSPLHVLTSHFCATCRSELETEIEILDILHKQMRKTRDLNGFKNVTKAITS